MRSGIFLLLGTNLGDRLSNLAAARRLIHVQIGPITRSSSIYETAAWGNTDQPTFYNQVIVVDSALAPQPLLAEALSIEHRLGRVREEKWGPRLMDIDILFYDSLIVNEASLNIPHVGVPNRRFVLEPLNEIAPDLLHPGLHKRVRELLKVCEDTSSVKKL
jgi:2-amino-4-hydroxy-6-hydroxymethyldihydropteridine diphosphokinase